MSTEAEGGSGGSRGVKRERESERGGGDEEVGGVAARGEGRGGGGGGRSVLPERREGEVERDGMGVEREIRRKKE